MSRHESILGLIGNTPLVGVHALSPNPDVRQAVDPAWMYVIVSLRDIAPMLRAYRIRAGQIAEVQVELDR